MSESVRILKSLIKLKSENPPGITSPQIDWIENWAKDHGINAETHWYENNRERGNITLSVGEANESIILTGHLDTVPAGDLNNWEFNPFAAEDKDGYILGRGSADMKGGIAACLSALNSIRELIEENKLSKHKIIFLGTSDEEVGLEGAKAAVKLGLMKNTQFLIVTEPTALEVGIAEKGVLWLSIYSYGKSGHGSKPETGINAIDELVKLFPLLKRSVPKDHHHILGQSTLNIGTIKGGTSVNVVPESAEIHCDFRLVPPYDPEKFTKKIEKIVSFKEKTSKAHFKVKVQQIMPLVITSEENQYVKEFLKIVNKSRVIGLSYGTDAAILASGSSYPIPFVIYGPGNPKEIHVSNERVSIKEVLEVETNLVKFIKKISILTR